MSYNSATPIVEDQTLIYAGGGHGVTAVKIEKESNRFVAKELWSNAQTSVQFNTPVLKNGLLFGMTPRDELFCMNAQDGKTLWTAPMGGQPPEATRGPGAGRGGREAQRGQAPGRGGRGGMRGGGMRGRPGFGSIVDAGSVLARSLRMTSSFSSNPVTSPSSKWPAIRLRTRPPTPIRFSQATVSS